MSTEELLKNAWDNIDYYKGGTVQLDIKHPLEWHVGYETKTSKSLIIITNYYTKEFTPSKCISTMCNKRKDGKYYISLQLTDNSQEDVFLTMCSNLIDYSGNTLTEKEALKKVIKRYNQWRRLMEKKRLSILSDHERRGLIGELFYLQNVISSGMTCHDAVSGWIGPDGADQDFVYSGIWREIKSTGQASDSITIHSVEQLGKKGESGELVIYRIDPCAPETDGAFTLRSLVHDIFGVLESDSEGTDSFENKLSNVGYIDMEIYDQFPYQYFGSDTFNVDDNFPRISREVIPSQIINCEYDISISAINRWKRIEHGLQ